MNPEPPKLLVPGEIPPEEIFEAALKVELWMTQMGYKYWSLMGICDRRFEYVQTEKAQQCIQNETL